MATWEGRREWSSDDGGEPGNFKVMRKEENEEMKLLPKLNLSSFELEKLNEIG